MSRSDKIRKLRALAERGATEGERRAARDALDRMAAREALDPDLMVSMDTAADALRAMADALSSLCSIDLRGGGKP